MNAATTSRFHSEISPASRQRSVRRRSMSSSSKSIRDGLSAMRRGYERRRTAPRSARFGPVRCQAGDGYGGAVAELHYGPARVPSRDSPEAAIELLEERGFTACEIDFEGKFWMDYPWAERFGELARDADIVLSVHRSEERRVG